MNPEIKELRWQIDRLKSLLQMATGVLREPDVRAVAKQYGGDHVLRDARPFLKRWTADAEAEQESDDDEE